MSRRPRVLPILFVLLVATPALAQTLKTYTDTATGGDRIPLNFPVPLPIDSLTPVDGFRSYASLDARLQSLAFGSDQLQVVEVGRSMAGRPINAYVAGGDGMLDVEGRPRPAFFINAATHAREWAAPEVSTGLLERLVGGAGDGGMVRYLLDNTRTVVIPVHNVDGFLQTQRYPTQVLVGEDPTAPSDWPRDGRMRRKNMRGVDEQLTTLGDHLGGIDLNRNHPPFWATRPFQGGSSNNAESLTFHGSAAHSEAESSAFLQALELAPTERLRLGVDVHSFGRVFFSGNAGQPRLLALQSSLLQQLTSHHLSVSGKSYAEVRDPPQSGIGTASEYFAYQFRIPAWTLELEPGSAGASEYGGSAYGHGGFILPTSQVRRVRESWAESFLVAFYRMAGPPHLARLRLIDTSDESVMLESFWRYQPQSGGRELDLSPGRRLVDGRRYRLELGFSKPMRHRVQGAISHLPGIVLPTPEPDIRLLLGEEEVQLGGAGEWNREAADGLRYRDDTYRIEFVAEGDSAGYGFAVATTDMVGLALDSDPSTPVDWVAGGWSQWQGSDGSSGDSGGIDRSVYVEADEVPVESATATLVGEGDRALLRLRRLPPLDHELRVVVDAGAATGFDPADPRQLAVWAAGAGGERSLQLLIADNVAAEGDRVETLALAAQTHDGQVRWQQPISVLDNDSAALAVLRVNDSLATALLTRDDSERDVLHALVLDGDRSYNAGSAPAGGVLTSPLHVFGSGASFESAWTGGPLLQATGASEVRIESLRVARSAGTQPQPGSSLLHSDADLLQLSDVSMSSGAAGAAAVQAAGALHVLASHIDGGNGTALRSDAETVIEASTLRAQGSEAVITGTGGSIVLNAATVNADGSGRAISGPMPVAAEGSLLQTRAGSAVCDSRNSVGEGNIVSDTSCGFSGSSNQVNLRLQLQFDPDSGNYVVPPAALDAADRCATAVDRRGAPRPQGTLSPRCDVGSTEQGINPYRGLWIPSRSGHGLDLQTAGNRLVVVWYSYGTDGQPAVYQAVGELTGSRFDAPLLRSRQLDGEQVTEEIGSFGLDFESNTRATLHWQFEGTEPGSEALQAYVFAEGAPRVEATGLWYDPADSGWGISLTRLGAVSAMALYYWDAEGEMRWALGTADDADAMQFDLLTFTGFCPDCDADANPPIATPAGSALLHVHTPRRMRVDIDLQGEGQSTPEWMRQRSILLPITDRVDNRQAVSEVLGSD